MKYGIECEGRLKGLPTLFCAYSELSNVSDFLLDADLRKANQTPQVGHVYISMLNDELEFYRLREILLFASQYKVMVTVEACIVDLHNDPRGRNSPVTIMLNIDKMPIATCKYKQVNSLADDDQVKFSFGHNVLATAKRNFVKTTPIDFKGDIEINYE